MTIAAAIIREENRVPVSARKYQQMQLTQLVAIADSASGVKGMTLFANGNIIQLIEGERTVVGNTFRELAHSIDFG